MDSNKNRLIIFDCFGVVFGEVAPVFFRKHFAPEEAATLKEKFFVPADLGLVTYDELFDNIAEELGMDKDEILTEWNSIIHLNEEIIPVIKELKKSADVILLSNAVESFVERIFEEHSLTELFDRIFISCYLKMAKPDPAIYQYAVSQMNKEYDEIYMIDDNIKNVENLHEIGIHGIQYKNIESLDILK
ncbi:MAG: HAD-IA family hydrolase [Clostridia bacterium]|nr:HAD-IA family hydrolase [Clostridia bacterium]